jgi:hypothetical protein
VRIKAQKIERMEIRKRNRTQIYGENALFTRLRLLPLSAPQEKLEQERCQFNLFGVVQEMSLKIRLAYKRVEVKSKGEIMFFAAILNRNEGWVGNCESASGFVFRI